MARTDDPYESSGDDTPLLREVADTKRQPPRRPVLPAGTPQLLVDLCARCWANNPQERPSFEEVHFCGPPFRLNSLPLGSSKRTLLCWLICSLLRPPLRLAR